MRTRNKNKKTDLCILLLAENPPAVFSRVELRGYIERMTDERLIKKVYHLGITDKNSGENILTNLYARREFLSYLKPGKEMFMGYFLASIRLKENSLKQFKKRFPEIRYKIYKAK